MVVGNAVSAIRGISTQPTAKALVSHELGGVIEDEGGVRTIPTAKLPPLTARSRLFPKVTDYKKSPT